VLAASDASDRSQCLFGATAEIDGPPFIGECNDAVGFVGISYRDTVATVVISTTIDYAIRDVPLDPRANGSDPIALPLITRSTTPEVGVAMHRGTGAVTARTGLAGANDL